MIVYKKNVNQLLKAAAIGNIYNQPICLEEEANNPIFGNMDQIQTQNYEWKDIIVLYQKHFNKDINWIHTGRATRLKEYIYIALRNSNGHKYDVCIKAAKKAFQYDPEIIIQNSCKEAKDLNNLRKGVLMEVHLLKAFIRFSPLKDHTLLATVEPEHDSMDLLLIQLRDRYPIHRIVLLKKEETWIMEKDHIFKEKDNELFKKWIEQDDFHAYWQVYYKSQYIESRKNLKLASKMLPKKYWNWLDEGKCLLEEERNPNRVL